MSNQIIAHRLKWRDENGKAFFSQSLYVKIIDPLKVGHKSLCCI